MNVTQNLTFLGPHLAASQFDAKTYVSSALEQSGKESMVLEFLFAGGLLVVGVAVLVIASWKVLVPLVRTRQRKAGGSLAGKDGEEASQSHKS